MPPSPFPFLKPGFVKRKRGNKLEPEAIPCFYIGPSPNRPRDFMTVMLRPGAISDSRLVTLGHVSLLSLLYLSTRWILCLGVGGEDQKPPQSSDPRRWSLLEWSPTRAGRTRRTSDPRGVTLN